MFHYVLPPVYYKTLFYVMIFVMGVALFWLSIYFIKRKSVMSICKSNYMPLISIIIPVYNGAKPLPKTLDSIFSSNYPKNKIEIVVVNDGSTDDTLKILKSYPVKIINLKTNQGKVNALNKAIKKAKYDIIISLDDDSLLEKNTLKNLARHFKNKEVGAVAGVYRTRSKQKIIEKLQGLEYICYGFMRKLQEALGAVLIVPGAVAAYRKQAILDAGGFDNDTMIEDYDMTIKLHKIGWKVNCDRKAVAWVCAPQTIRALIGQRTRWFRGGLQIFRKHSDLIGTKMGTITLLWSFEVANSILQFVILALMGTLAFQKLNGLTLSAIISKIQLLISLFVSFNPVVFDSIFIMALFLTSLGFLTLIISIKMFKASWKTLLVYPLMAVYSTLLLFVFIKSVILELTSSAHSWYTR